MNDVFDVMPDFPQRESRLLKRLYKAAKGQGKWDKKKETDEGDDDDDDDDDDDSSSASDSDSDSGSDSDSDSGSGSGSDDEDGAILRQPHQHPHGGCDVPSAQVRRTECPS